MTFTPTRDWQPVPPGAVLPPGCQTRMNLDAQTTEARLALVPHLDDARRFLELLDGEAEFFTFQIFDDTPRKDQNLARTIFGDFDRLQRVLHDRQHAGGGVFVTINRTLGGRRRAEYVDLIRAVFVDLDGAPLQPVLACDLEPHIVVESSPGKFQAYWLCEDVPLDQFAPIQKAIAARFGGDPKVCDLPRVMRMPGFWHQKGEPFLSRIIHVAERLPYDVSELLAEFPVTATTSSNGLDHDGDAQTMADLVRAATTAENYHDALRNLAYRYVCGGMDLKDAVRTLQGLMDASAAPRDTRFEARYNDIPRAVETAQRKLASMGVGFDLTDDGLALAMGREWEADARYCAEWGKWIFWRGDCWEVDRTKLHLTRTRTWMRGKAAAIVEARPSMHRKAAALRDDAAIYAIDRLVTSDAGLATTADAWDQDTMLLGGPQTVDLRTGEARDPRPSDCILRRTSCEPAPEGTPAPLWLRFLAEITDGDRELQDYMRRMVGYWLTGSVSEHAFFFGHGIGANGKSTFVNVVRSIMGDYATTIGSEVLMWSSYDRHPTELAKLRAVRLAVAGEIERGKAWAESKIKSLTGGDEIQARFMRQDFFTFTPQFKLMVIGNHKPSLRAVDEAIRRRLHLVPFVVTIPPGKRDKHLENKLKGEAPAILRWMIAGCLELQERGLDPPKIVQAATADYLASEDTFELWRETCVDPDPREWTKVADLWESWRRFAEGAGEPAGSQKSFANTLADHGFKPHRTREGRGYYGGKLRVAKALGQARGDSL